MISEEINEIENKINSLKLRKFDGNDINEYYEYIENELVGIAKALPGLVNKKVNSNQWSPKIFRARIFNEIDKENFMSKSQHRYPPQKFTENGRANFKNNPVFYGSDNPNTCLIELNQDNNFKLDVDYCLTSWSIKPNSEMRVTPYLYDGVDDSNPFNVIKNQVIDKFPEIFGLVGSPSYQIKREVEILKLFSRLFLNDKNRIISSYIAYQHLYKLKVCDIFLYPSIQMDRRNINFAIHPDFVDSNMKLDAIYRCNIKSTISDNQGNINLRLGIKELYHNNLGWYLYKDEGLKLDYVKEFIIKDLGGENLNISQG